MIMIILGAGASYDSVPFRPPSKYPRATLHERMPLASELFLDEGIFQEALARFPRCKPVVPYLQDPSSRLNMEATLETLQSESETDIERKRQLAAIRYYLHYVIWECERAWNSVAAGVTNYITLLDQVRRSLKPNETVSIVTFNYDRMIENALRTVHVNINALPEYVAHDTFKLYKLHGSVHWGRIVHRPEYNPEHMNAWDAVNLMIEHADQLDLSDEFRIVTEHPLSIQDHLFLFPALAIPVQSKCDFECPPSHISSLKKALPLITKLIVLGWKGADLHFLSFLKGLIKPRLPVCIVAENRKAAEEVAGNFFAAGIPIEVKPINGGFSEFIVSREAETFLRSY